jgi:hypothetical protein
MSAAQSAGRGRRPSPALAVAMLALVLGLAGTGYAASQAAGPNLTYIEQQGVIKAGANGTIWARCASGSRPTGGGFDVYHAHDVVVLSSAALNTSSNMFTGYHNQAADAWAVNFLNNGTSAATVYAYAVCAPE